MVSVTTVVLRVRYLEVRQYSITTMLQWQTDASAWPRMANFPSARPLSTKSFLGSASVKINVPSAWLGQIQRIYRGRGFNRGFIL